MRTSRKGSSTWKGTSRGYFQTYPNGATNFYGVTFGATRAAWDMTDSDGAGWFMALASFDSKSSGDARLMVNPTNANAVGSIRACTQNYPLGHDTTPAARR